MLTAQQTNMKILMILGLTPQLIPVFAAVLGEPKEQLEDSVRAQVKETVKYIAEKNPVLVQGNEALMKVMRA